ncbi:MAG TPA: hypothetical protein VFG51_03520 [Candidatus Saccharimonadia bacterium]|nr:hypothetical protein [Candidatus Saccharimonadia bacterium]
MPGKEQAAAIEKAEPLTSSQRFEQFVLGSVSHHESLPEKLADLRRSKIRLMAEYGITGDEYETIASKLRTLGYKALLRYDLKLNHAILYGNETISFNGSHMTFAETAESYHLVFDDAREVIDAYFALQKKKRDAELRRLSRPTKRKGVTHAS